VKRQAAGRTLGAALLLASSAGLGCGAGGQTGPTTGGAGGIAVASGGAGGAGPSTTGGGGGSGGASGGSGGAPGGSGGNGGVGPATGTGGAGSGGAPGAGGAAPGDAGTDAGARDGGTAGAGGAGGLRADAGGSDAIQPATTIWLAGDSTVQTYVAGNTEGNGGTELEGWGQELAPFFNDRVVVNNQAIGGRSVAFYMWAVQKDAAGNYLCIDDQGNPAYQLDAAGNRIDNTQWARVKAGMKAGDFVLIQFGTNDETHTCPRFVSLPEFETDFGLMADTIRAKGATPIFVTPMGHREFVGTMVNNTLLPYANAMKAEATLKAVELEDLNLRSVEYYAMVGNAFLATNIFDTGTTHFIKAGAIEMASLIVGEIRAHGGPLAAYLK
jgi:lysophospholipase L1-like esterase